MKNIYEPVVALQTVDYVTNLKFNTYKRDIKFYTQLINY